MDDWLYTLRRYGGFVCLILIGFILLVATANDDRIFQFFSRLVQFLFSAVLLVGLLVFALKKLFRS